MYAIFKRIKRIIAIIVFGMAFGCPVSAQTIDSLHTTEQVVAFLNQRREIDLDSISEGYNNRVSSDTKLLRLAREFDAPTFSKADIDQNGYTDLVFNGKCLPDIDMDLCIVMMAFGVDSFQFKYLGYPEHYLLAARLQQIEGRYYLRTLLFNYKYHHNEQKFEPILRYDTLQYSCGEFIEKGIPEEYTIDSIKFYENASPLTEQLAFSLFIKEDSITLKTPAFLKHIDPGSPTGTFTCSLDQKLRRNLDALLRHSRFTTLQDHYWSSAVCVGSNILKVYYSNGREKRVESTDMGGTFGLAALLQLLHRWRETLPWKLTDPDKFFSYEHLSPSL